MTLQKATVGKGINIVFMGDAYTDRDMGRDGLYRTSPRLRRRYTRSTSPRTIP